MERSEHLQWCKERALEYVDAGDIDNAFASMASDMRKHEETASHPALMLGMQLYISGHLGHPEKMRKFINGFN